jgi:YHS domain-containing protein
MARFHRAVCTSHRYDPYVSFYCVVTTGYVVIAMEKDPVCKMNVDKPKATETFKGKTYHFCSNACKSTFDRNRDMFIGKE